MFIGILVFPIMAMYIIAVIYLTLRKDTVTTFIEPEKDVPTVQNHMEKGFDHNDGVFELGHVPYREDLADIPLPK